MYFVVNRIVILNKNAVNGKNVQSATFISFHYLIFILP